MKSKYAAPALLLTLAFSAHAFAAETGARCHTGAYRLDDGRFIDVTALNDPEQLRWRMLDGRSGRLTHNAEGQWSSTLGWTERPDGMRFAFGSCEQASIRVDGHAGRKQEFVITETSFAGNGVTLHGRLVLPKGHQRVPIVVEVHGSEDYSAVQNYHTQYLYPAHGIGVFVYDKRGTGGSTGQYTQDFHLLSDDAKAALAEARRLAGKRVARIGFDGGSQGGWVAPLAASKSDADFVVVSFGMADSPLSEDRDQVLTDLRAAGFTDATTLAQASEVSDATGQIVASHGARGWEQLEAVRAKYAKQPWWSAMKGEYTGLVVSHTREELLALAPTMDKGTTWDYDPMPVLRGLQVPELWVLGGSDIEAPPEETRRRLLSLQREGRPISTVVFPDTDHGILEFETAADGERKHTRHADGYYRLLIDWIKSGKLGAGPYGRAEIALSARVAAGR
ncbi:alpha/beta hydrolase family protein [Lysobacter tyrosinilyticus]